MAKQQPLTPYMSLDDGTSVDIHLSRQGSESMLQTKPLPRLPRGWSRICHETGLFLRTVGLGIVVTTYHSLFRKDFSEPVKVAIRRNRLTALLRTFIHLIPLGVALTEIILNSRGHYIGSTFTKQNYYQFAAKAHELCLLASVATVVLSYIRHELSVGKGIPFGVILGSQQFSQISYLWSTELWSSLSSSHFHWKRKLGLIAVIIPCTIIAATAGPSSATLLIPRKGLWNLDSTHFSLNGSFQDLWPDQLDGSQVPQQCAFLQQTSADLLCPSIDWNSFYSGLQTQSEDDLGTFQISDHSQELYFYLSNADNSISKITQSLLCTSSSSDQFCASSPQEILLEGVLNDFYNFLPNFYTTYSFEDSYHEIQKDYYQPYTIVSCVSDSIDNSTNSQNPVQFARISETESELRNPRTIVPHPYLTNAQILGAPGNTSEYRTSWVELPNNVYNDKVFGVVLLSPRGLDAEQTQNITSCTIGAGWGISTVRTDSLDVGAFYSTIADVPSSFPMYTFVSGETEDQSDPNFANISGYQYPQRRIDVSLKWAEFLNPVVPSGSGGTNTTVMNSLLSTSSTQYNEVGIAKILGIMVASGLGRHGVGLDISNSSTTCEGCLQFTIQHSLDGWSYNLEGTITKLALVVMLVYSMIAFAHILYSSISGISSTAWDSTAEVVALAMNSSPTTYLQNTCAGIIGARTFQTPVRILTTTKGDDGKEEHLELVFGPMKEQEAKLSCVKVNTEYGRLAVGGD